MVRWRQEELEKGWKGKSLEDKQGLDDKWRDAMGGDPRAKKRHWSMLLPTSSIAEDLSLQELCTHFPAQAFLPGIASGVSRRVQVYTQPNVASRPSPILSLVSKRLERARSTGVSKLASQYLKVLYLDNLAAVTHGVTILRKSAVRTSQV